MSYASIYARLRHFGRLQGRLILDKPPSSVGNGVWSSLCSEECAMVTMMPSFARFPWPLRSVPLLFSLLLLFPSRALNLHVVPGSNCTAVCSRNGASSDTSSKDITCIDKEYNTTDVGRSFQRCISCEMESHTFDHETKQTDLGWALCKFEVHGPCPLVERM